MPTEEIIIRPAQRSRLSRLLTSVRGIWSGPITSNSPELARFFGALPNATGVPVNEWTALNYAAVWSAVARISGDISSLPLFLYRTDKDGRGKTKFKGHPLYRLLHDQPNPEMTSMVWRRTMQAHALTWGNAYSEIERDGSGRPVALWPLTPDRVTPIRSGAGLVYRVANPSGGSALFDPSDMLHLHGLGYDGTTGYSVIHHARESVGLGLATERFGGTFFGNGSTFGGILSHPGTLTEPARKNLQTSLAARHQGVDRAHRFVVLEEGLKYEKLGIPPDDAQFLETRKFQIEEIARWFNIPPHKIGSLDRSTHSNIEQQETDYYISSLGPWLQLWEQELTAKLVASSEVNIQIIEHNLEGKLRGDSAARGTFYGQLFSVAGVTPNEIREIENRPPLVGGDRAFVPLNMVPMDRVDEWIDAQIAAQKPAPAPSSTQGPAPEAAMNRIAQLEQELAVARRMTQEAEDKGDRLAVELATRTAAHEAEIASHAVTAQSFAAERAAHLDCGEQLAARTEERDGERRRADAAEVLAGERGKALDASARDVATAREEVTKQTTACVLEQHRREAVEAELADVKTARAEKVAEVTALQARLASTEQAVRAAVVDRVAWLIGRESDRARRVQGSPDKLRKWVDQFYADYADLCRTIIRPSVRAWVVCANHPEPVEHLVEMLIGQHLEQSVRQFRTLAESHDSETLAPALEKLLRRWEVDRAETVVNRVLREAA